VVPEITATELKERLDAGDSLVLVDVREPFESEIVDLPEQGQARIPTGEFQARSGELSADDELVIYCRSGARSARVVAMLNAQGYERVLNLRGGVLAWRTEVDPTLRAY